MTESDIVFEAFSPFFAIILLVFFVGIFLFIVRSFIKGLKSSPKEFWLLLLSQLIESSVYTAIVFSFNSFFAEISDSHSWMSYIVAYSSILGVTSFFLGSVSDAIGIKRTLFAGTAMLLFSRFFLPWLSNVFAVLIICFIPMIFAMAIMAPIKYAGIKRFTTKENRTLGFGLFYSMTGISSIGAISISEGAKAFSGNETGLTLPLLGLISSSQIVFIIGFLLTVLTFFIILKMRNDIELTADEVARVPEKLSTAKGAILKAWRDAFKIFLSVFKDKTFRVLIFMLSILVFVRMGLYHFDYTYPKYSYRIFGGKTAEFGYMFGVLNSGIVFLFVPFVAVVTKKISSYKMLVAGTFISAFSAFIATMPGELWSRLVNTWFGEFIYGRLLNITGEKMPEIIGLALFIIFFSIGEAIWSPRLMQFILEAAPKGKEGTYAALSVFPWFAGKFFLGPVTGIILGKYVPPDSAGAVIESYPDRHMVWIWIGIMFLVTPVGLIIFRKLFKNTEGWS